MSDTANLQLPYILPSQAQKHVTHNEALRMLDAIIQLAVLDRDLDTPPLTPQEGDRYIVAAGASGDWAGHAGDVAHRADGAWMFAVPRAGWVAWVADEEKLLVFDGAGWTSPVAGGLDRLGINTGADAVNRLAVASDATLFDHAGAGHQHKVNKATSGDTASFLFQTGYSGRAEIGLTGDDKLHVKVSADGTAWTEAMVFAPAGDWIGIGGYTSSFVGASPSGVTKIVDIGSSSYTEIHVASHHDNGNASQVGYRSRGSMAAPMAVVDADWLFSFFARGHDGTAYRNAAGIRIAVGGTPASNSIPGRMLFQTTPVGGTAMSSRLEIDAAGQTLPGADNAYTLGQSGQRWSAVWAATGTIQTSDARDKDVVGDLACAGALVDSVDPVLFRWKIGGNEVRESATETTVDDDGNEVPAIEIVSKPGVRTHAGFLAQDLRAAMDTAGVDFGAWGLEDKDDPDSRQFMRPDQLIAVLWAALKETRARLDDVRNELNDFRPSTGQ